MEVFIETSPIIESTASYAVIASKDAKAVSSFHHIEHNYTYVHMYIIHTYVLMYGLVEIHM